MSKLKLRTLLESKQNLISLIGLICNEYKLDPTLAVNVVNVKSFLEPLSSDQIVAKSNSLGEANAAIVKLYGTTLKANRLSIPDDIDRTRKYLLKVIKTPGNEPVNKSASYKSTFGDRSEGIKEGFDGSILDMSLPQRLDTIKYLNYSSLFRDEYIFVDSRYQNTVNADPTQIAFSLITTTKTKSDHGGVIVGNRIQDIVEVEVYPFTIPYNPMYVTFYNKITLSINEWASNSFEAYEGGQFHFCFEIDRIDNNLIYLRPINSTYSFSKPMNYIDNFTLSFGAVFPKISFDSDRAKPIHFDYYGHYGLIRFNAPHRVVTGDLIYITDFNTPDPAGDVELINEINRSHGHTIVKRDNWSFIINIDLSPIRKEFPPLSRTYPIDAFDQTAMVYFASKRIQIQFRLKYLTTYAL
jgi:hypothetical protein